MYILNFKGLDDIEYSTYFETKEEAIKCYKANLPKMAYGYISDDEALETAEEVKQMYEEELEKRKEELNILMNLFGNYQR